MEWAFHYHGNNPRGERLAGTVFARDTDHAHYKVRQLALDRIHVNRAPLATLRGWVGASEYLRDLAILYRSLADKLDSPDVKTYTALETALDFIESPRLRDQIAFAARGTLAAGVALATALRLAGFPARDCALLEATQNAGELTGTLRALADQLERELQIRSALNLALVMPLVLASIAIAFFAVCVLAVFPRFLTFAAKAGIRDQLTPWVRDFYESVVPLAQAPFGIVLGAALLIAALWWAWMRGTLAQALEVIPTMRRLRERVDMCRIWGAWISMDGAGLPLQQTFELLAASAERPLTRQMLTEAARLSARGSSPVAAIKGAGFPKLVIRYAEAAAEGTLARSMQQMIRAAEFEIGVIRKRLEMIYTLIALSGGSLVILFIAAVTVMEFLKTTLAMVNR
jgi:type II secretory pathway component PulF